MTGPSPKKRRPLIKRCRIQKRNLVSKRGYMINLSIRRLLRTTLDRHLVTRAQPGSLDLQVNLQIRDSLMPTEMSKECPRVKAGLEPKASALLGTRSTIYSMNAVGRRKRSSAREIWVSIKPREKTLRASRRISMTGNL